MKVLVANLGSTSFKYRLFDMASETQMARGGIDRIGSSASQCVVKIGDYEASLEAEIPDHGVAVSKCLEQLTDPTHGCLQSSEEVAAIGFKAVHGGRVSGVQRVTSELLNEMETMNQVAPAHNPPYIAAMRQLAERCPDIPLVAAFETGFHMTIPDRLKYYATPKSWGDEFHVKRWGFHGASHRYIAGRIKELSPEKSGRVISCHLGGSSSLCAIRDGQSAATTMGMSPQSGLPHNNRVGDIDPFALPVVMAATGKTLTEVLADLASQGGLLGLSGLSGDMRDLEKAAADGHQDAQLALDVFASETRRHLGGLLVELGGVDAIVFTGGIGENGVEVRKAILSGLEEFGIQLDDSRNSSVAGESMIQHDASRCEIWVVPTNEELIVARQSQQLLSQPEGS